MPSDFSKELLGIHASPLVLSVSSRKEQMSPRLEYNEVGECIAMPTIKSGMYWAFDKCFLRGKKKKRGKEGSGEGGTDEGKKEDREGRGTSCFFPFMQVLHMCMLSHLGCVWLFAVLWMVPCQAPLSMGFSRQEHWSGLPCPPSGDLPEAGIELLSPASPALGGGFFTTSTTWETHTYKSWFPPE